MIVCESCCLSRLLGSRELNFLEEQPFFSKIHLDVLAHINLQGTTFRLEIYRNLGALVYFNNGCYDLGVDNKGNICTSLHKHLGAHGIERVRAVLQVKL